MPDETETSAPLSPRIFWSGLAFLLLAIAASVVLVGQHLDVLIVPGCGEGSPCAQAAASAWGKVPGIGWPVSFVGLAWFAALAIAWIAIRGTGPTPRLFRNLVRVGALGSAMFMVVMIVGRYVCPYCIAAHIGNFGFLAVLELGPAAARGARRGLAWAAAAFVAVTGIQVGLQAAVKQELEAQLKESTEQIIAASTDGTGEAFTGRYRVGPANAPIRLVIFSDFQCPDCRIIEGQVRDVLARYDTVSYAMKHFPFCTACNPYVKKTLHPNACWAARAAEAAGILRGAEGFHQMHEWLFDHGGSFTHSEITAALQGFGYDPAEFLGVMQSDDTLQPVQADIEEAFGLGMYRTPMIFINGSELKGWMSANALSRAVDTLAAQNLPPGSPTQDRPDTAFEKYVADWRDETSRQIPADMRPWSLGPEQAAVDVVLWGDLQEPFSGQADTLLRRLAASRGDVRYSFRQYPIDQVCNPVAPRTMHPQACLAARAAEAAGSLGGADGYWAMHAWLVENREGLTEEAIVAAAAELGITGPILSEMTSRVVADAIAEDARAAKDLGLRSVPFIFIDGKRVPRWRMEGTLEAMLDEAARAQSATNR